MVVTSNLFKALLRSLKVPSRPFWTPNIFSRKELNAFLEKILGVQNGLEGTFSDLNKALNKLEVTTMVHFQKEVERLPKSDIFDSKGRLLEDRPKIFHLLDRIIH